ncbi:hypothetical protein OS493_020993 [Desmophyllum pertusum]|uniref:DUF4124 domain-containing protein n=1 Tax=Desmophyllum pertusum TaxID=174260 RepID=A0A9X0D9W6_9CNID|nr:hypothetical protein OS493_020993 [Desmophyllum pertusum]
MARMSNLTAFFLIWSCGFCYSVQVFVKGAHGMVTWKDSPSWRDRSVVPTPPQGDVEAYKKRGEIPYPYPRAHVVKHVYVGPRASIEKGRKRNRKKNLIQRIFFSLPVGAELPIYYTHKQVVPVPPASHKKSTVANSEVTDAEGSRYFSEETDGPFRSNTWGLPQQPVNAGELLPDLETRTVAQQNLLPFSEGGLRYHGIGGQYLRPRLVDRNRVFKNSGQFFKRPSRTQGILNVYRRSKTSGLKIARRDVTKTKKQSLLKQSKEKTGYVTKDKDTKKSGLPKGSKRITSRGSRNKINSEIENLLTKLLIVL